MREYANKAVETFKKHFSNEQYHYSEFEFSDIEYFVAVMLYNQFAFTKALETMKTMEIANDFLDEAGETFNEVEALLKKITFESEEEAVAFLLDFIQDAKKSYKPSELYLLNRIEKHITLLQERYEKDEEVQTVDFTQLHKKLHPALRPQPKV